jgi:hypothetical protein
VNIKTERAQVCSSESPAIVESAPNDKA